MSERAKKKRMRERRILNFFSLSLIYDACEEDTTRELWIWKRSTNKEFSLMLILSVAILFLLVLGMYYLNQQFCALKTSTHCVSKYCYEISIYAISIVFSCCTSFKHLNIFICEKWLAQHHVFHGIVTKRTRLIYLLNSFNRLTFYDIF